MYFHRMRVRLDCHSAGRKNDSARRRRRRVGGGCGSFVRIYHGGIYRIKAIDPNGCRPFDATRYGLSPGEAGAAIVLVRENLAPDSAIKISGWGSSNDAN